MSNCNISSKGIILTKITNSIFVYRNCINEFNSIIIIVGFIVSNHKLRLIKQAYGTMCLNIKDILLDIYVEMVLGQLQVCSSTVIFGLTCCTATVTVPPIQRTRNSRRTKYQFLDRSTLIIHKSWENTEYHNFTTYIVALLASQILLNIITSPVK